MKKNQIYIFLIAFLLVAVGYIGIGQNYPNGILEVSANPDNITSNEITDVNDEDKIKEEHLGEATLVSSISVEQENDDINQNVIKENENKNNEYNTTSYFINSKLDREKMYLNLINEYEKMLNTATITGEQKVIAQNEIIKINNERNSIMIVENLLKTKDIDNCLILINNESINVILDKVYDESKIAQIQNIITRELNANLENIHISNI